jgi:phosphoglycerate dehydrogenase-like enzyme
MRTTPLRVLTHLPVESLERVSEAIAGLELRGIPAEGELPSDAEGEILLTLPWGGPNLGEAAKRGVRWIHTIGTGVDRFPLELVGDRILTCSRGASAIPIAEWVLACMLGFEKQLPQNWISAPPERWILADLGSLHGRTLGLVGLGAIALASAERALSFGMRVRACRRKPLPSPLAAVEIVDFGALLESADHLVLAVAATPATHNLMDSAAFARVKPGVHLVNVSRGSLVDQDALREALDDGRVALASLDVVTPEPLPEGHWLYSHPRVRLSPHISWSMPGAFERLLDTFVDNLRRYAAGEPLQGLVDLSEGY